MAKHIHIHVHRTSDAGSPKHAPAGSSNGGQFVSGSGGGSGPAAKVGTSAQTPLKKKPVPKTEVDLKAWAAKKGIDLGKAKEEYDSALKHAQKMFPKHDATSHANIAHNVAKQSMSTYGFKK